MKAHVECIHKLYKNQRNQQHGENRSLATTDTNSAHFSNKISRGCARAEIGNNNVDLTPDFDLTCRKNCADFCALNSTSCCKMNCLVGVLRSSLLKYTVVLAGEPAAAAEKNIA